MMATTKKHSSFSAGDLRNPDLTVADVMRTDFRSCNPTDPVAEVASALQDSWCRILAVSRAQVPIGMITDASIASALAEHGGDLSGLTAGDLVSADPSTIPQTAPLSDALSRLADTTGLLLAVNEDGMLVGVTSLSSLAPHLTEHALGRLIGQLVRRDEDRPGAPIEAPKSHAQPQVSHLASVLHPDPLPLVSQSDLVNPMLTVADVMAAAPRTCSRFSTALEAALIFRDVNCRAIPVTEDGRVVGVVTDRGVALALADHEANLPDTPLERLMTSDAPTIAADAPLDQALASLGEPDAPSVAVVDSAGNLAGVLSWTELAPHLSECGLGHAIAAKLGHNVVT